MKSTFSFVDRNKNIRKLKEEYFDLLIIGGGINGAGVARDAASRGMKVALIEAKDFASGTSSRSSKLVHGGIRYLENKEFKLVFEALSERAKLFKMAPHLVHPLRFMLPLYKGGRVGMGLMGLGMWLYDALALFKAPEMHERLNPNETLERMSDLLGTGLLGSYVYSDAYMDDDRLVIETLRSANDYGANCVNYVSGLSANYDEHNKIKSVNARDMLTGENFVVRAKHVVSSLGVWTDQVCPNLVSDWKKILRPTKGIHLTIKRDRLKLPCAVVMAADKDSRIVFGIPRHDMVIVGTTDTDFKDSPDGVVATREDVDYLLKVVDHYFPGAKLTRDDIIASYAGVRPLVFDGSSSEGKTSREHTILDDSRGLTIVAGGKYTTYRKIAEDVVEHCLRYFSIEDQVGFSKSKSEEPLNPLATDDYYNQAINQVSENAKAYSIDEEILKKLTERHGLEAIDIIRKFGKYRSYWGLEAAHAIENTMCLNLVDFYSRRTPLFLGYSDHGLSFLDDIIAVFKDFYSWNDSVVANQKRLLSEYMSKELNWKN